MKFYSYLLLYFFCLIALSSCGVVEAIFKAGMIWAIFLIALLIGIVVFAVMKMRKK